MGKKLHPSVSEFKSFVQDHPRLVRAVRNKEYTWQELYEDWYLLGEEDPKWNRYKADGVTSEKDEKNVKENEKGWLEQMTSMLKNMDLNQMQHHIGNLSQAIATIQSMLSQFQQNEGGAQQEKIDQPARRNPFLFRQD